MPHGIATLTAAHHLCLGLAALGVVAAVVDVFAPLAEVRYGHTPVPIQVDHPSYFSDVTGIEHVIIRNEIAMLVPLAAFLAGASSLGWLGITRGA